MNCVISHIARKITFIIIYKFSQFTHNHRETSGTFRQTENDRVYLYTCTRLVQLEFF